MNSATRFSIVIIASLLTLTTTVCCHATDRPVAAVAQHDGTHDFDFLYGTWKVHNRRLVKRLAGSQEWQEFEADDSFHALPSDIGSEENYRTAFWKDFAAVGLHLYNHNDGRWTLYWTDNRNTPGHIDLLASGTFSGDTGTFFADDTFDGKPIRVRVRWRRIGNAAARWEQAFSNDGEKTWETNWTMDFHRVV